MRAGRLLARWSKREGDLLYSSPSGPDGHLIHAWLTTWSYVSPLKVDKALGEGRSLLQALDDASGLPLIKELEERGYDLTTLRFQIDRSAEE